MVVSNVSEIYYGLSTDTKPTTSAGSLFVETDLGRMMIYDGSVWQSLYLTRADVRKVGTWWGSANTTADGIIGGRLSATAVGTASNSAVHDENGIYTAYSTGGTINSIAGHRCGVRLMTRINNCYFKSKFATGSNISDMRIFFGFVAATADPASSSDPLNALEGVGLWYDSAVSGNIKVMHNDTSGASAVDDTSIALATTTDYTIEIYAVSDTKFQFVLNDGAPIDISSNIPTSTTTLGFRTYLENTAGSTKGIDNHYITVGNDQ